MRVRGLVLGVVGVVAASVVGVVSPVAADDGGVVVTETGEALEVAGSLVEDAAPLADTGDGFVASVAGSEVELPVDPSEPLVFGGVAGEIGVGLPVVAGVGEGVVDESGAVVYESGAGAVSLAAQATVDGGLQVLVVIDGADAPSEYRFDMSVPAGATLVATADGGAEVVGADGQVVAGVAPAWALDADGQPVPTRYRIEGTTLVQVIDHHGAAYPVVGDPNFGFFGVCDVFTGALHEIMTWNRRIQPVNGRAYDLKVVMTCGEAGPGGYGWRHIRNSTYGRDHVADLSGALRSSFGVGISEYTYWDSVAAVILNGRAREVAGNQVVFERSQYFHQANRPSNCRRAEFKVYVMVSTGRVKTAYAENPILRSC
jgi:hypothetical protein